MLVGLILLGACHRGGYERVERYPCDSGATCDDPDRACVDLHLGYGPECWLTGDSDGDCPSGPGRWACSEDDGVCYAWVPR